MKMVPFLSALFLTLAASAQSVYFNQWFTNIADVTNSFQIGSNTLAVLMTPVPSQDQPLVYVDAYYEQGTVTTVNGNVFGIGGSPNLTPILGPCTAVVHLFVNNPPLVLVWRLDSVNGVGSPGQFVVQPAGYTATIGLQTSTNLTTWQSVTNVSYGKTNANRFFRMSLTIP